MACNPATCNCKPKRLTSEEVEDIASMLEHRLDWATRGPMSDDTPKLVARLIEHARLTPRKPRKRDERPARSDQGRSQP